MTEPKRTRIVEICDPCARGGKPDLVGGDHPVLRRTHGPVKTGRCAQCLCHFNAHREGWLYEVVRFPDD